MAKAKDKKLMMELLRYPAQVHFRDDRILVLRTTDEKAFHHYTEGLRTYNGDDTCEYIVRTYKDEMCILRQELKNKFWSERGSKFTIIASRSRASNRNILTWISMYPSLIDAFEKEAKEIHFLPLIRKQSKQDIYAALNDDPSNIEYVHNLTHKRRMAILEEFPETFRHMKQSPELARHAIEKHGGDYLKDVKEDYRTDKLCLQAVRSDGFAIRYVPQQTERLCLTAVSNDGRAIKYVKNPTFAVKVAAVNSHPDAWECIKDEKERKKIKKAKGLRKYRV